MEPGIWPFHKICWVAVGRGTLESEDGSENLVKDDFLLLPAGWSHRFVDRPGKPLTLVIFCLSKGFVGEEDSRQITSLWKGVLQHHRAGVAVCAQSAFHRHALIEQFRMGLREQENRSVGWETALEAVAGRVLVCFGRRYCESRVDHRESSSSTVAGAAEYLRSHPYERLQIEEVAKRCGISARRFTELFKKQTGKTFSHYLNHERIRYACRRLEETGHILYACHESGFNDLAYFYRVFKNEMEMTPGQFLESVERGERSVELPWNR